MSSTRTLINNISQAFHGHIVCRQLLILEQTIRKNHQQRIKRPSWDINCVLTFHHIVSAHSKHMWGTITIFFLIANSPTPALPHFLSYITVINFSVAHWDCITWSHQKLHVFNFFCHQAWKLQDRKRSGKSNFLQLKLDLETSITSTHTFYA